MNILDRPIIREDTGWRPIVMSSQETVDDPFKDVVTIEGEYILHDSEYVTQSGA